MRRLSQEKCRHVQFTIQFADGGEMIPVQRVERTSKPTDKDDVQQNEECEKAGTYDKKFLNK